MQDQDLGLADDYLKIGGGPKAEPCAFDWRDPWTLICLAHSKPHFVVVTVSGRQANLKRLEDLGFLAGQAAQDAMALRDIPLSSPVSQPAYVTLARIEGYESESEEQIEDLTDIIEEIDA